MRGASETFNWTSHHLFLRLSLATVAIQKLAQRMLLLDRFRLRPRDDEKQPTLLTIGITGRKA
jgi:hypothetical protein